MKTGFDRPGVGPGLNNLAALLSLRFNELDKAYELARKARELAPGEAVVADTLGGSASCAATTPGRWVCCGKVPANNRRIRWSTTISRRRSTCWVRQVLAAEAFNRALAIDPAFPHAEEARERLALLEGDGAILTAEQIAARERHLQKQPKDPVVLSQLAAAKARAGDLAGRGTLQRRAVLISPDGTRLRLALAHLLEKQGEITEALEQARMARRLAPDNAEIGFDLGQLAYRLRDYAWSFSLLQDGPGARRRRRTASRSRRVGLCGGSDH
jgi:tetratricopeptide (TPR) repeat protein